MTRFIIYEHSSVVRRGKSGVRLERSEKSRLASLERHARVLCMRTPNVPAENFSDCAAALKSKNASACAGMTTLMGVPRRCHAGSKRKFALDSRWMFELCGVRAPYEFVRRPHIDRQRAHAGLRLPCNYDRTPPKVNRITNTHISVIWASSI